MNKIAFLLCHSRPVFYSTQVKTGVTNTNMFFSICKKHLFLFLPALLKLATEGGESKKNLHHFSYPGSKNDLKAQYIYLSG